MTAVILLICIICGIAIYFAIVRPMFTPLTQRIPTGKAYRATLGAKKS